MTSNLNYFRSLNWNSTVYLEVSIIKDDYSVIDTMYICPYRNTYPFLIYQHLKHAFLQSNLSSSQFSSLNDDEIWFEVVDLPNNNTDKLKFHWNIGLSYDYYTFNYNSLRNHSPPLKLVLHLSNSFDNSSTHQQSTKLSFMGSLKESQFIYWGSVKRITQLKTNQTEQLWQSIQSNDFDDYFKIANKLLPLPINADGGEDNDTLKPRSIPIKFILPDQIVIQDIFPPNLTLQQALSTSLPILFPSNPSKYPSLAYPVLHGSVIPLEANISWLASSMSSPDGFLRFCIILY